MKLNRFFLFVFVIFFLVSGNFFSANATLIDFETLYDGTEPNKNIWSPDVVINEYQALGVTFFGGGLTDGTPRFRSWEGLNESIAERPPASNKFHIRTDQKAAYPEKFDLNIFFDSGVHAVSGDVIYNPGTTITVNAYDEFDNLIDSMIMLSGQSTWIGGSFSFISSSPIFWIHLVPDDFATSAGLDNLLFDPVPEPATMILFGVGLLGIAGVSRRKE